MEHEGYEFRTYPQTPKSVGVAELIRIRRERKGLTKTSFARKMSVTPFHIWAWECGFAPPTCDQAIMLSDIIGGEAVDYKGDYPHLADLPKSNYWAKGEPHTSGGHITEKPPHGLEIFESREAVGFTRQKLAKAVRVQPVHIWAWELGTIIPTRLQAEELANHLGGAPDDYLPPSEGAPEESS